jgi:hypothetical protein
MFLIQSTAVHVNFSPILSPPEGLSISSLTAKEQEGLKRGEDFVEMGAAYSLEHATRPSTIGLVLGSSPVALLAWIGEKFLAWSDEDPALDKILESVTLYWLTETFPTSIYPYRVVRISLFPYTLNQILFAYDSVYTAQWNADNIDRDSYLTISLRLHI